MGCSDPAGACPAPPPEWSHHVRPHALDRGPQLTGAKGACPLGTSTHHLPQRHPTNPTMTETLQTSRSEISWGHRASPWSGLVVRPDLRKPGPETPVTESRSEAALEGSDRTCGTRRPCFLHVQPASGPHQTRCSGDAEATRGRPCGQDPCTRAGTGLTALGRRHRCASQQAWQSPPFLPDCFQPRDQTFARAASPASRPRTPFCLADPSSSLRPGSNTPCRWGASQTSGLPAPWSNRDVTLRDKG